MLPGPHHPRKQRRRYRIFHIFSSEKGVEKPADVRPRYNVPTHESSSQVFSIPGVISTPQGTWGSGDTKVDSPGQEVKIGTVRKISLWDKAYETLPQEDRTTFLGSSEHQNPVRVTLRNAEMCQKICYEKRWKFNWKGKELLLHDVVSRIMTWIEKFETIGDIVSQYDLSHAALPWTGFRLLLQVGSTLKFPFTPYREFQVS